MINVNKLSVQDGLFSNQNRLTLYKDLRSG